MKNNLCIRYSKNNYLIKGCNMFPARQPNNIIKVAPTTAQTPKVPALRVKEVSDNNKSGKKKIVSERNYTWKYKKNYNKKKLEEF
jgi:hypothetical protein